jgi:acyl-CoA synthetase (AMP-forming)/AMP-acid ligase II
MRPPSPLLDAFDAVLRDRADDVLLMSPGEQVSHTARDLHQASRDLERPLRDAGLTRGHLVMASVGNVAAMPALVLACLRQGWPLMPVDRSTPVAGLRALAATWAPAALVLPGTTHLDASPAPGDAATRRDTTRLPLPHGLAAYVPGRLPSPGQHAPAAVLKLTSGSTGTPRATCTEERHLVADVRHIAEAMDIGPRDRQLGVIPLSHSYGFSNLLLPLLWQGSPLLLRPQFVPTQVAPDIIAAGLHTFAGVPFMFEHLARHEGLPRHETLRLVVSAGARLAYDVVEAFHRGTGLKIRSFYGSSETGGICFDASPDLDPRVPVGRPMGDTLVTLIADGDAPEGAGRVQVCGPNVIDRYMEPSGAAARERAGAPRETPDGDAAFTAPGTFRTGDYARLDADGMYVLTGRVSTFINVAGRKVHPGEVERVLRTLPGVADAVAMAVEDPVRGQALGTCLATSGAWTPRTIREALSSRLAPYQLPRVIVIVPQLPITPRGKVDRQAVARLLAQS